MSYYMVTFPKVNPSFYGEKEIVFGRTFEELHAKIRKWGKNPKDYVPETLEVEC